MSCILRGLGKQTINLKRLSAGKTCFSAFILQTVRLWSPPY